MPRPKTRKVGTKVRPGGMGFGLRPLMALGGAALGALLRVLAPLKDLALAGLARAFRSRPVRRVGGLCAALGVCMALSLVMLNHLRGDARYQIDPARIELSAAPTWAKDQLAITMKSQIEHDLRQVLADQVPTDAFDAAHVSDLARALEQSPWVRSVIRIERRFPSGADQQSRLYPQIEMRRPVMMVEGAGSYVALDGDGVVLPLRFAAGSVEFTEFMSQIVVPLRIVRGIRGTAPEPGTAWRSEQVAAALSMEEILRRSEIDKALPIDAIELIGVPERADSLGRVHYTHDGGVTLWPDQQRFPGACLIWGRPPVHGSTLEASPNEKLAELRRRLESDTTVLVGNRIDLRLRAVS